MAMFHAVAIKRTEIWPGFTCLPWEMRTVLNNAYTGHQVKMGEWIAYDKL